MSDTIYCGSGKKQNDKWLKITINPDKLKDHIQTYEGNRFIKLNVNIKDEKDQYGKDVSISVDTWKPDESQSNNNVITDKPEEITPDDSLPF